MVIFLKVTLSEYYEQVNTGHRFGWVKFFYCVVDLFVEFDFREYIITVKPLGTPGTRVQTLLPHRLNKLL